MKFSLPITIFYSPFEMEGEKQNMYYGASSDIFKRAEELRKRMTPAEETLWKVIHVNEWKLKFRRQHPIAKYVVDFYCHNIKLVIELDGGIHEVAQVKRYDTERENNLKELGLTVLRFKNEEVLKNLPLAIKTISDTISRLNIPPVHTPDKFTQPLTSTPLGDGGEGNRNKRLYIIKIGGNIIDDESKLAVFLAAFARIESKKILVHGGGKLATRIGEQLGIQSKYIDGRRITDMATLDLVTMVYGGLINKKIVAQLQSLHCNAIGITGADANLIPASKRPLQNIDYGFAGDVNSAQLETGNWQILLTNRLIPVVAPLTHDGKGNMLNTNADTIAQEVAKILSKIYEVQLIYSFEKAGVLLDANDETTIIPSINPGTFDKLKAEQKIFAGMIPKLENAFEALNSGVQKVIIGNAENLETLINGVSGTSIINE